MKAKIIKNIRNYLGERMICHQIIKKKSNWLGLWKKYIPDNAAEKWPYFLAKFASIGPNPKPIRPPSRFPCPEYKSYRAPIRIPLHWYTLNDVDNIFDPRELPS